MISGRCTLVIDGFDIALEPRFGNLSGLRILHISDLHLTGAKKSFDRFFSRFKSTGYDLVVCSGDLIDSDEGIAPCAEYLSGLRPRYGTFVAYGNHDRFRLGLKQFFFFKRTNHFRPNNLALLRNYLERGGVRVLENEVARLSIKGVGVTLIGLDCPLGFDRTNDRQMFRAQLDELEKLVREGREQDYVILVSHVPDLIDALDLGVTKLVLASHTHGGQIRLPFIGPLVALSRFQRQYNRGLFRVNGSFLHVSSGLGQTASTPIRLGCPPRATILTLKGNDRCA